ncbi:zinc knuckle CX2CX4HX4C containing protein [Tanacetum coccineum]
MGCSKKSYHSCGPHFTADKSRFELGVAVVLSDLAPKKRSNPGDLVVDNVHGNDANVVISLGSGSVSSLEEPDSRAGNMHVVSGTASNRVNEGIASPATMVSNVEPRVEQVGNEHVINEFPSSYATKLSPTSLTKANIRKLKVNVPNDADYDVWLPLASVNEVNGKMKNPLYEYFIGKRLAFPVLECFVRNNWEKVWIQESNDGERFFLFKFSSIEGLDSVLQDGPWMIRESGGDNGGNKNFKPVSLKSKPIYRPKAKQSADGTSTSPKRTPIVDTNEASTLGYNKYCAKSSSKKDWKLVLVDDDRKPLKKVDYLVHADSEDEVE